MTGTLRSAVRSRLAAVTAAVIAAAGTVLVAVLTTPAPAAAVDHDIHQWRTVPADAGACLAPYRPTQTPGLFFKVCILVSSAHHAQGWVIAGNNSGSHVKYVSTDIRVKESDGTLLEWATCPSKDLPAGGTMACATKTTPAAVSCDLSVGTTAVVFWAQYYNHNLGPASKDPC